MNYQSSMIPMKIIEPLGPLLLVVVQLKFLAQDHGVGPSVVGTGMLGLAWCSRTAIFFMCPRDLSDFHPKKCQIFPQIKEDPPKNDFFHLPWIFRIPPKNETYIVKKQNHQVNRLSKSNGHRLIAMSSRLDLWGLHSDTSRAFKTMKTLRASQTWRKRGGLQLGKSSINEGFSIARFDYQRVAQQLNLRSLQSRIVQNSLLGIPQNEGGAQYAPELLLSLAIPKLWLLRSLLLSRPTYYQQIQTRSDAQEDSSQTMEDMVIGGVLNVAELFQ